MSIFPKRLLPGATVTIHWNFNTSHLKDVAVCPRVRIGVTDPTGNTQMLLDKHVLALPSVSNDDSLPSEKPIYLSKPTPLLVLANYLSGRQSKEKLVDILTNIQSGRHYYFQYTVPSDALPGKYTLVSEVHSGGRVRLSTTAEDDFFLVEKVVVGAFRREEGKYRSMIRNLSPEPAPVKVVDYMPGKPLLYEQIEAFEIPGRATREVVTYSPYSYLFYNEEREMLPLAQPGDVRRCIRNQDFLELAKEATGELFLMHTGSAESYALTEPQACIWRMADGIQTRDEIRKKWPLDYDELLSQRLIEEIQY